MRSSYLVYFFAFLFNIFLLSNRIIAADQIVEINNGKIAGNVEKNYYSFKGIPYAKPPVNELRFESPQKQMNWEGVLDAKKFASTCLRLEIFSNLVHDNNLVGSEDCLYLNVFTPNTKPDVLLPVLIYIHQGGFISGSGDDLLETRLMDHQSLVLVTFNYRLGPLGFLSTGDNEISGNMGLKDQRMVLEWVNENIKYFGGDPTKVLLSGFSAGAASVQFHLLTEGIDNLIKSAWSFSGSALNPWAVLSNPTQLSSKFGGLLNCSTSSTVDLKKCLKSLPADVIVSTVNQLFIYNNNPFRIFGPVVESSSASDPFITSHPEDLIKAGKCSRTVPWVASFTTEDAGVLAAQFLDYKESGVLFMEDLNENLYEYLPVIIYYGENMSREKLIEYTDSLLAKYGLIKGQLDEQSYKNLTSLFTNRIMKYGILKSIYEHKRYCSPTYSYIYDNPAPGGFGNLFFKRTDVKLGTVHGDDIFLILNFPLRDQYEFREDEKTISEKFIKMIENFALTGTPVFGDTELPKNYDNESKSSNVELLHIKADGELVETYGPHDFTDI